MKYQAQSILTRIDELITNCKRIYIGGKYDTSVLEDTIFGTVSILRMVYGEGTEQSKALLQLRESYIKSSVNFRLSYSIDIKFLMLGILSTLRSDIDNGFISSIQNQAAGEIYGNFTSLAKSLVHEGHKDPAAVLACGALEDSMKKFAMKNGLNVYEQELSGVVNALKAAGLLKGAQSGVVQSFVKLRNKIFHAQFDKVELPEIMSLISFVETFILQNFD